MALTMKSGQAGSSIANKSSIGSARKLPPPWAVREKVVPVFEHGRSAGQLIQASVNDDDDEGGDGEKGEEKTQSDEDEDEQAPPKVAAKAAPSDKKAGQKMQRMFSARNKGGDEEHRRTVGLCLSSVHAKQHAKALEVALKFCVLGVYGAVSMLDNISSLGGSSLLPKFRAFVSEDRSDQVSIEEHKKYARGLVEVSDAILLAILNTLTTYESFALQMQALDEKRLDINALAPVLSAKQLEEHELELRQIAARRSKLVEKRKNQTRPWSKAWKSLSVEDQAEIDEILMADA